MASGPMWPLGQCGQASALSAAPTCTDPPPRTPGSLSSLLLLSLRCPLPPPAHSLSLPSLPPPLSLSLSLPSSILFSTLSPSSDLTHPPGLSSADTHGESFLTSPHPQGVGALRGEACPPCPPHRQRRARPLYWNCRLPCGSRQSGILCPCTCEAFQMRRLPTAPPAVFVWTAEATCINVVGGWNFRGRSW